MGQRGPEPSSPRNSHASVLIARPPVASHPEKRSGVTRFTVAPAHACGVATVRALAHVVQIPRHAMRLRLLCICSWNLPSSELRDGLRARNLEASIARVDIEAALRAALGRGGYSAAIYVRGLPGLGLDLVHTQLLLISPSTPLLVVDRLAEAAERLASMFAPRP